MNVAKMFDREENIVGKGENALSPFRAMFSTLP